MSLMRVSKGKRPPKDIYVVIEIPAHSDPIKYEVDKETGILFVDRFISTCMRYPCNYGYIPETLSEDGDPLDVLVIAPIPVNGGCVIRARPIGLLRMTDESGIDMKILAVPHFELTPLYDSVTEVADIPKVQLSQITHFFSHYKDLEPGKWVKMDDWGPAKAAEKEILAGIQRFLGNEKTT